MGNLLKSNLVLLALSGVEIVLKVFNQIQVANYYGTTTQRDTYFLANALIVFLFTVHYRSVALFFLPRHTLYLKNQGQKGLGRGFIWVYFLLIALLALLGTSLLFGVFAAGLSPFENSEFLLKLLFILLAGFVFQTGTSLQAATYHCEKVFILPALRNIFTVLLVIFSVYYFHEAGIEVIAWSYLLGNAFFFSILLLVRFQQFTQQINWAYHVREGKLFFRRVFPYVLLAGISLSIHLIEPLFVAKDSSGTISFLGYSYQIVVILLTLISKSILTTFYPRISEAYAIEDHQGLRKNVLNTIQITFVICISIAGFVILFGNQVIDIVFVRGQFNAEDSLSIYRVLRWEVVAFIFGALNLLLNRFFYLKDNKRILLKAGVTSLICYLLAAFSLHRLFDYEGLGMALVFAFASYFTVLIVGTVEQLRLKWSPLIIFFLEFGFYVAISCTAVLTLIAFLPHMSKLTHLLIGASIYCLILLPVLWLRFKSVTTGAFTHNQ